MQSDELELVQRIVDGETNAFEEIVKAYEKKVYSSALRMCKNVEDAEDIAQEAFLRLYKALPNFKGDSSLSTYLYRITANLCVDALRKNSGASVVSIYTADEDGEEYTIELPDGAPSPLEQLERKELAAAIREAIDELPDISREIIVLREIDGLSYKEIEETTGLEEGTVKSRLLRARRHLCNLILQKGNIFEKFQSKEIVAADSGKEVL